MRLCFSVLSGQEYGYGHLNRCLSIADYARKEGFDTTFIVIGEGAEIVCKRGHEAIETVCPSLNPTELIDVEGKRTVAIIDVAHPSMFSRNSNLTTLIQAQRKLAHKVIAIDSLGDYSFSSALPRIPVDAIIAPYVGAKQPPGASAAFLSGSEYALLDEDYAGMPARQISQTAQRVLLTFGGSDPQALTLLALTALSRIKRNLLVRVVIGPLYSAKMTALIKLKARSLHHDVELLHSPRGLVHHMQWTDIAVAASGLVKYELAASGTPSILISIDEAHDLANQPFAKESLLRDLRRNTDITTLSQAIEDLLDSPDERRAMAARGQHLIDGKGVQRLIAVVKNLLGQHG